MREENEIEKNENESEDGVVEHSKVQALGCNLGISDTTISHAPQPLPLPQPLTTNSPSNHSFYSLSLSLSLSLSPTTSVLLNTQLMNAAGIPMSLD